MTTLLGCKDRQKLFCITLWFVHMWMRQCITGHAKKRFQGISQNLHPNLHHPDYSFLSLLLQHFSSLLCSTICSLPMQQLLGLHHLLLVLFQCLVWLIQCSLEHYLVVWCHLSGPPLPSHQLCHHQFHHRSSYIWISLHLHLFNPHCFRVHWLALLELVPYNQGLREWGLRIWQW